MAETAAGANAEPARVPTVEAAWRRVDESGVPLVIARLLVGLTFLVLGYKKLVGDPADFLKVIHQYHLFPLDPPHLMNMTAVVLPWFEVIVGLCLILGVYLRAAGILSFGVLAAFTVAIFIRAINYTPYVAGEMSFFDIQFDCGCGAGEVVVWEKLVKNSLLVLFCLPLILSRSRRWCLERGSERAPEAQPAPAES